MTVLDSSVVVDFVLDEGVEAQIQTYLAAAARPAAPDALFVALAEPLVTKDVGLARAAAEHTSVDVRLLASGDH